MNITLDDTSPVLQYLSKSGTWSTNHSDDGATNNYYDQTFHGTFTDGDAMSLSFNGSAIAIYGAKRANHGTYSAQLDGGNIAYMSGYDAAGDFQSLLYSAGGLSLDREHTVVLTNLPSQTNPPGNATVQWWLDIDYAVITTAITSEVYTTTYDDTYTGITYTGTGEWTGGPLSPQSYYNRTAAITQSVGNALSFSFNGSSIALFGGLYVDHGNYSVTLDGNHMGNYNGTFFELETQVVLFVASNLTESSHSIVLTNLGGPKGNFVDFDYAVVNSTINPASVGSNATNSTGATTSSSEPGSDAGSSSGSSSGSSHTSHAGAIAGGVVGGVVGAAIIAFLMWFFLFRRRARGVRDDGREPIDLTGAEVKPYLPAGESTPAVTYVDSQLATPGHGSSASTTGYGGFVANSLASGSTSVTGTSPPAQMGQRGGYLSVIPPPPASSAASYPQSTAAPSTTGSPSRGGSRSYDPFVSPLTGHTAFPTAYPLPQSASHPSSSVSGENVTNHPSAPSSTPSAPSTAGQPSTVQSLKSAAIYGPSSPGQAGHQRLSAQDLAHVGAEPSDEGHGPPPPDYHQATGPAPEQQE